jgi:hypothetical protein
LNHQSHVAVLANNTTMVSYLPCAKYKHSNNKMLHLPESLGVCKSGPSRNVIHIANFAIPRSVVGLLLHHAPLLLLFASTCSLFPPPPLLLLLPAPLQLWSPLLPLLLPPSRPLFLPLLLPIFVDCCGGNLVGEGHYQYVKWICYLSILEG